MTEFNKAKGSLEQVKSMTLEEWLWSQPNTQTLKILNTGVALGLHNEDTNQIYLLAKKTFSTANASVTEFPKN